MGTMESIDVNKELHRLHERTIPFGEGAFDLNFDDTKRHAWMINLAKPLTDLLNPKTLLTVGDGRGREAFFISKFTSAEIVASDIGIEKLQAAAELGLIQKYCITDIENIEFKDSEFDVSFVKESLHHLPRPIIGLYEMIRISSKGVIVIEPNDAQHKYTTYPSDNAYYDDFEETNNYLYRFSLREIMKIASALHLKFVIARGFNDPWRNGFKFDEWEAERESLDQMGRENNRHFDLMSILIITDPSIEISTEEKIALEKANYQVFELPRLPKLE